MNAVAQPVIPRAATTGLPTAAMTGLLAILAFGVISTVTSAHELDVPGVLAPAELAPEIAPVVPNALAARSRSRCDECGTVESMHRVDPGQGMPAYYDIAVRLRDGSLRHSQDASPGRWQVGDRAMAMGGASGRAIDAVMPAPTLIR